MSNRKGGAPKADGAAEGAGVGGWGANGRLVTYHPPSSPRNRLTRKVIGPDGEMFVLSGLNARTLMALVRAGVMGVTVFDAVTWTFRLAAHCHVLRHTYRLSIVTLWEAHEGGRHARYVLRTPVTILQPISG